MSCELRRFNSQPKTPDSSLKMNDRLRLTFTPSEMTKPVVCHMAREFKVDFSIRRANIEPQAGWMDLELSGEEAEIERAIAWLEEHGVRVSPAGGDVLAG